MARAHKNLISMINCADFSSHAREGFQDLAPFSLFEGAAELFHELWFFASSVLTGSASHLLYHCEESGLLSFSLLSPFSGLREKTQ